MVVHCDCAILPGGRTLFRGDQDGVVFLRIGLFFTLIWNVAVWFAVYNISTHYQELQRERDGFIVVDQCTLLSDVEVKRRCSQKGDSNCKYQASVEVRYAVQTQHVPAELASRGTNASSSPNGASVTFEEVAFDRADASFTKGYPEEFEVAFRGRINQQVPCYYDPLNPVTVTVTRPAAGELAQVIFFLLGTAVVGGAMGVFCCRCIRKRIKEQARREEEPEVYGGGGSASRGGSGGIGNMMHSGARGAAKVTRAATTEQVTAYALTGINPLTVASNRNGSGRSAAAKANLGMPQTHARPTYEVTIASKSIGMEIAGAHKHSVRAVDAGGAALAAGVLPGSELLVVGTESVEGLPHAQCLRVLQRAPRPVKLKLALPRPTASDDGSKHRHMSLRPDVRESVL